MSVQMNDSKLERTFVLSCSEPYLSKSLRRFIQPIAVGTIKTWRKSHPCLPFSVPLYWDDYSNMVADDEDPCPDLDRALKLGKFEFSIIDGQRY